jgi:hypothetical protein
MVFIGNKSFKVILLGGFSEKFGNFSQVKAIYALTSNMSRSSYDDNSRVLKNNSLIIFFIK